LPGRDHDHNRAQKKRVEDLPPGAQVPRAGRLPHLLEGQQEQGPVKIRTLRFKDEFRVVGGSRLSQAAEMVLKPGAVEGGPDNRHRGADQWLYVASGTGRALVNGKETPLRPGSLLFIERGDVHEIRNTGKEPLRTVNVYAPPAYDAEGEPLPAGRK
jgi:mannose-6-phosphate isomerase-like protein (cupin superfamily)